jgi:hypothetical protein
MSGSASNAIAAAATVDTNELPTDSIIQPKGKHENSCHESGWHYSSSNIGFSILREPWMNS